MTEKLYDTDAYLATFSATVLDCIPVDGGYDVILDRTAFFPEGGGQYGDTGKLNEISVTDTQIRDGIVSHRTNQPLAVGQTVEGTLHWAERFRRMQNHSGEHIVSGIVHSTFGYDNVGFHLSDEEMTMDYSGELSAEDLLRVEDAANRAVWENRAIRCEYPSAEELETLWYRSKKELTEAVRIVTVEGVDCCACCAPHVKNTGEIGGIYIVDAIKWKGGTRLTVRCGEDAYGEYSLLRSDEKALSALFSAPRGQIFAAAEKLQRDSADLRRQHNLLQKEYALLKLESQPFTEGNLCFSSPCAEADVMRTVANEGIKKCTGCFVCLAGDGEAGYRYVIAAAGNLRAKANQINTALSGRGGGSDTMIQGSFSATEERIREFFKEFNI
ncbi:MAG: alanyl-tRNA editing protein [Clostridia bacterium]|nr:alanyl-tRNA editing protein [Clostridia bacterium]